MTLTELVTLIALAFKNVLPGRRPVFRVLLKQIYFTGLETLKVIMVISILLGTVIITEVISLVGVGNEGLTGKVLVWVVVRELGPLLTAIIVIARSGAAIATELGYMKINGEIDSIASLGISPDQYLIMPRIFGVTAAVVVLTVYFEILAVAGGFLVASLGWHVQYETFSQGLFSVMTLTELGLSLLKSIAFGLFLSAACCRQGLYVGKSATQIPQAATKGVMQSLFLVFILDGLITVPVLFL
ncbi:ABC transporter permease [Geomesophilobacter sediminis]|uniref:ABC transporter permease n=1 Tax=Geomesophilobacter sediminis TaxID=2798584 RepID=UPI002E286988|nr:ABC transporter permease [Geomesophilobacter sediminis]